MISFKHNARMYELDIIFFQKYHFLCLIKKQLYPIKINLFFIILDGNKRTSPFCFNKESNPF